MMGKLNYFLRLQVKQMKYGIFINQAKYTRDLIKIFGVDGKVLVKIPINTSIKLDMDLDGKSVD